MPCFGFVTNSGKTARLFFMPVYSLAAQRSLSVSAVTSAAIRKSSGGYIGSSGADLTSYISASGQYGGAIYVDLINPDGWGETNNTPLAGQASVSFTVRMALLSPSLQTTKW